LVAATVEAIGDAAAFEAREYFWEFRKRIRPDMKRGWWVAQVESELQKFREQLVRGDRPKLALMVPPQHGKSWAAEDFIAWIAGNNPELKTIYASYSDDLGTLHNANLQRRFQSHPFRRIFPNTRIGAPARTAGDAATGLAESERKLIRSAIAPSAKAYHRSRIAPNRGYPSRFWRAAGYRENEATMGGASAPPSSMSAGCNPNCAQKRPRFCRVQEHT